MSERFVCNEYRCLVNRAGDQSMGQRPQTRHTLRRSMGSLCIFSHPAFFLFTITSQTYILIAHAIKRGIDLRCQPMSSGDDSNSWDSIPKGAFGFFRCEFGRNDFCCLFFWQVCFLLEFLKKTNMKLITQLLICFLQIIGESFCLNLENWVCTETGKAPHNGYPGQMALLPKHWQQILFAPAANLGIDTLSRLQAYETVHTVLLMCDNFYYSW